FILAISFEPLRPWGAAGRLTPTSAFEPCERLDRLLPIERVGPSPWVLRLVKPITRPNEVICREEIACRIGNKATPAVVTRARFHRAHQSQLESVPPMRP